MPKSSIAIPMPWSRSRRSTCTLSSRSLTRVVSVISTITAVGGTPQISSAPSNCSTMPGRDSTRGEKLIAKRRSRDEGRLATWRSVVFMLQRVSTEIRSLCSENGTKLAGETSPWLGLLQRASDSAPARRSPCRFQIGWKNTCSRLASSASRNSS